MSIRYEWATDHQGEWLAERREALLRYHGEAPATPAVMERMADFFRRGIAQGFCWVVLAYDGETLVGNATLYTYERLASMANPMGKLAYITDVWTKESHRRQGIARTMVSMLMEVGFRQADAIRLHASAEGKMLYPALGFVPTEDDFVCYRKD